MFLDLVEGPFDMRIDLSKDLLMIFPFDLEGLVVHFDFIMELDQEWGQVGFVFEDRFGDSVVEGHCCLYIIYKGKLFK